MTGRINRYPRLLEKTTALSRRVARSRLAPAAVFPVRTKNVAKHDARVLKESLRWLFTSREHTNYTYDLTDRNVEHLAWFVASVTAADIADVKKWIDELAHDEELRTTLEEGLAGSERRRITDPTARYGRRIGWYALVRARKPRHVVESGIDKGLGSALLAAALLRNTAEGHPGRLTALDINPDAGYLLRGRYREITDIVIGDSLQTIPAVDAPVDLFIHDSWHSAEHESAEFELIAPALTADAVLLTDNAAETDVLAEIAERTGRRFLYFQEVPDGHWHPGDGTGIAWRPLT